MNFTNLKNFMDDMTRKFVPGNAASVYYHNREVFRYASGYSDRENGVQMTGDELMFMYSCTKPATVVAAMQLLGKDSGLTRLGNGRCGRLGAGRGRGIRLDYRLKQHYLIDAPATLGLD